MSLTKQEKIALAEAEVEVAKNMIAYSRRDLDKWLNTLEIRQEYLEAITKVSDLVVKSRIPELPEDSIHEPTSPNPSPSKGLTKATSDVANPPSDPKRKANT